MKLGMLTACLPDKSLPEIAAWAAGAGYEALEVAAWPDTGSRDFEAAHLPIADFDAATADRTRALFEHHGLRLSALAYYENNLHPDPRRRNEIRDHLTAVIDAAAALGVRYVGTFIGRNWTRPVTEDLAEAERIFHEIVDYAGERDVLIVIENCVMEGWHPDGYPGNLAYSPELWEWMFSLGLYLNFDPSHLVWLGIDPVTAVRPYVDRIPHAQAKDIQIFPELRNRYGYPGKAVRRSGPWDVGWWRYRVPGRGEVDWGRLVDVLYECGFDGVLSVEHEDPVWSGDPGKVMAGLEIARDTLRPLIVR